MIGVLNLPRVSPKHLLGCFLVALLVIPYATGLISYFYNQESLFLRPATYLAATVGLLALNIFAKKPCLPTTVILLLILLLFRVLLVFILGIGPNIDPEFSANTYGASACFALGVVCVLGDPVKLRLSALACSLGVIGICSALNIWEWRFPGFYSTVAGRSAGWLENSNASAAAIVTMTGLLLSLQARLWFSALLIGVSGLGVYFTLSRSGFFVWLATVAIYVAFTARLSIVKLAILAVWCVGLGAGIYRVTDFSISNADQDLLKRQSELTGGSSIDIAGDSRAFLAAEAARGILERPLLGHGPGSTFSSPFSPHNQFLAVWLETGVVGAVLYCLALFFLFKGCFEADRSHLIGCIPLVGFIPFSHNLFEDKTQLFAWIVLAGISWHHREETRRRSLLSPRPKKQVALNENAQVPTA